jgi:hypothetical protein
MRSEPTIIDTIHDRDLFAPWFKDRATWAAWFVFLRAMFALPMTPEELALFQQCTGRTTAPTQPAREGWLVVGRRGGKSFIVALVAVFLACFCDYSAFLAPGERATVMVLACDRRQSRTILRYIRAMLEGVPMLTRMIERSDAEAIDLGNRVSIEIHTSNFRAVRGYTVVALLADEIAFWRSEDSANPDREILDAIRPATATIPGAVVLGISSPYARRGVLYEAHRDHFGKDGDPVLVWQAPTRVMNPTVPQKIIDDATERDPSSAAAEYGAQFRSDLESFINREVVEACTDIGVYERAPQANITYYGGVDVATGSGSDSFTAAVAHRDGEIIVVDAVREWRPPFSPEQVTTEAVAFFKSRDIHELLGDNFAAAMAQEGFTKRGIRYNVSDKTRSELYLELLPLLNSKRVRLLDHPRLVNQLTLLERRTSRAGRDTVDHPSGGHDDVANAVAAAVFAAARPSNTGLLDFYRAEAAKLKNPSINLTRGTQP